MYVCVCSAALSHEGGTFSHHFPGCSCITAALAAPIVADCLSKDTVHIQMAK